MTIELKRLVGQRVNDNGKLESIGWDMDRLFLNGRQVGIVNRVPGAAIALLPGAILTESEKDALSRAVAEARGGVLPAKVGEPLNWELLDDDNDEAETEVDDE